jgi:hypothetical protein
VKRKGELLVKWKRKTLREIVGSGKGMVILLPRIGMLITDVYADVAVDKDVGGIRGGDSHLGWVWIYRDGNALWLYIQG